MAATGSTDWKKEFGLDDREPPYFISSIEQLDDAGAVPQPHALRRAFEQLDIDGVLCQERSPIIYFRLVKTIDPAQILDLHRSFWNQGIAPILVVVAPNEVQVFSGLMPPEGSQVDTHQLPGLVEILPRIQEQLRSFLLSVESGEYFHTHRRSFDPTKRVDRDLLRNLQATRQALDEVPAARLDSQTLDALLCRLVFTCYLFDRGVIDSDYLTSIGIDGAQHLRNILAKTPRTVAKNELYLLFTQLGEDFNGDLFSADLEAESRQVRVDHLEILDRFLHGTDIRTGQQSFWPYDFGFIPIETISAIYEHFLKAAGEEQKKAAGAFYTPRFLAEFVLDLTLEGETSLLGKRFLDPACGSGIFLVGLFNRLAEEWKSLNPRARYDRRARELMGILCNNIYGIDSNRSACQITAFSLYLAFLDQLSPPDIQKLLGKWERLPYLVSTPDETASDDELVGTIRCADFFTEDAAPPYEMDVIVGNPPWGSCKDKHAPVARWCADRDLLHPDRQMANAFMWKAPYHLKVEGKVCFVLPHGVIFNHNDTAIHFQQSFVRAHAVDRVVNLTDFQFFLFEESRAPTVVIRYRKVKPENAQHPIDYWAPKTDWTIKQAEIVTILSQDRSRFTVRDVLQDLKGADAPQIWKERFWATPRDHQLLERLSFYPRLRDNVRQTKERQSNKPWIIAQGFQPLGPGDLSSDAKSLTLPGELYIEAGSISPFLLEADCQKLPSATIRVRDRSGVNTVVFVSPHVIVTRGFSRCAFTDQSVSFRSSVRGIHGPSTDRALLIFLSFVLRSPLSRYFLFHTSSNWGVTRAEVHDQELLRLPFPFPDQRAHPTEAWNLVRKSAEIFDEALAKARKPFADRQEIATHAQNQVEDIVNTYFEIDDIESMLIADTTKYVIPSFRPSRAKPNVPTTIHSSSSLRASYATLLCNRLNGWARQGLQVHAKTIADSSIGVGMVVLEKTKSGQEPTGLAGVDNELLPVLDRLQHTATQRHGTFELVRGLKVFNGNLLYITKPLGQRFWTNTAALNDADEIAATILMQPTRGDT